MRGVDGKPVDLVVATYSATAKRAAVALHLRPGGGQPDSVVLGTVVTVDDTMTTMLDARGAARFVPNSLVVAKSLYEGAQQIPHSAITAHGWLVEDAALDWLPHRTAPGPRPTRSARAASPERHGRGDLSRGARG